MINIDGNKCTGCRICVKTCPQNAIEIKYRKAKIDLSKCTLCGICIDACAREKAISITKPTSIQTENFNEYKNIAVFIEVIDLKINRASLEILGEAKRISRGKDLKIAALVIGNLSNINIENLIFYGADQIVHYKGDNFKYFRNELFTEVTLDFIEKYKPSIFLAGATAIGRSFIPQVAAQLNSGLTADCTKLEISPDNKLLLGTRPAFGGNLMATIICENNRPQFATVRPHVFKAEAPDHSRKGKIITIDNANISKPNLSEVLEIIKESASTTTISDAEIIVSGGHGLGSKENFALIIELSRLIGGTYGASRSAVDSGWARYSHQVGQTGKTVNPKLYLAFGISGAIQHIAGMQSSDYIIAVNSDPNAEIFNFADIGICGDALEIIPNIIKELKDNNDRTKNYRN